MINKNICFSGRELRVRFVGDAADLRRAVVTFTSYTDHRTLDRDGFGEAFFLANGVPAFHVISRDNDWYLNEDSLRAAEVVRDRTANFGRVTSYGSSMGAYAAIRLGRQFGAETAIAISPQFSLNKSVAPFEHRWLEAFRLDYSLEGRNTAFPSRSVIIYDPYDIDRRHVELYASVTRVDEVRVPFASHPAGGVLADLGLLQPMVLAIIDDVFDSPSLGQMIRPHRGTSVEYLFALSKRTRSPKWKAELARRVVEREPDHATFRAHYAEALAYAGRWNEAEQQFRSMVEHMQFFPPAWLKMAECYEQAGHLDRAIAILCDITEREPGVDTFHERLRRVVDLQQAAQSQPFSACGPVQRRRWWWLPFKG